MFKWLFRRRKHETVDTVPVDVVRYAFMGKNDLRTDRIFVPVDRKLWEERYDVLLDEGDGSVLPTIVYFREDGGNEVWLILRR